MIVGGVSLVTNYRDEFNEQIKNGGVDSLIKTLQAKNKGGRGEVKRRRGEDRRGALRRRPTAIAGRSGRR